MSDARKKYFNPRWRKKKSNSNKKTASTNENDNGESPNEENSPNIGENPRWKKKKSNNKRTTVTNENDNDDSANEENPNLQKSPSNTRGKSKKRNVTYLGWDLYFEDEEYKKTSPVLFKIEAMERFLEANPNLIIQVESGNIFSIDVNELYNSEIFKENWPDFKSELKNQPQFTLNCLGLAVYRFRADQYEQNNETIVDEESVSAPVKVRILNYDPIISLKNIKVNYYGKFITVRGCIIRVNRSCHMPSTFVLLCVKCKLPYTVKQRNGIYTPKKKCDICGGMKFEPDLSSPYVETIPMQIVRIQEHFGEEHDDQGRVPRVMDIELYDDLVDTCMPGDDVTITGIIKMQGTDNGKVNPSAVSALYIEANSVINNNSKTKNNGGLAIEFNTNDYKLIKDIHRNSEPLSLLVNSLCPGIYGHEMIKMALLLSLFGGSPKHANLRENIHILIVGDPGLGKSQMLQACARVAPKGIYVSGNSSTSSGLTVTLVREGGQSDFALEPGALVLADRGCCCIDEFDKMPTQHQSLLEAMEQQSVSVAKSGVIWSLPARTSILAAANPIGGRYDKSKILSKNLSMSQPLLSRFDLIFLLLDQPDKDLDNFLSGHVMLMHTGNEQIKNENFIRYNRPANNQMNSLRKKLIATSRNSIHTITHSALRKYISYARQYVKPKLSNASATILQKFYLSLRKKMDTTANLSPCNRQLEALIRLTEARAKVDLREETTEQDALDVVELLQHTVLGMHDEKTDYTFLEAGKSSRSAVKMFLKLLIKDAETKNNNLYTKEELRDLALKGKIGNSDVPNAIDKLNNEGFLIKRANDLYKFVAP